MAKVEWILGPFSVWCEGKWGSLWCNGWFRCRGTCSIEVSVCIDLSLAPDYGSKLRLAGCIGGWGSLVESVWASSL
jgi:hypothetical protein